MNEIITAERLKIYERYKGDGDGIARVGRFYEKEAFEPDIDMIWTAITSKIQDVELIKTGLVNGELQQKMIHDLRSVCDSYSFEKLTSGLSL